MLISHDILPRGGRPTVAALGFFDGVHRGHRAVIGAARREAARRGAACAVFSFDPPRETTRRVSKTGVRLLQSAARRDEIFRSLGVELLVCPPFESFCDLTPEEFADVLLVGVLRARAVVTGEDYRFGRKGSGDVGTLRTLCGARGIGVRTVKPVRFDGEIVSSRRIRELLAAGEISRANAMLLEPYRVEGPFVAEGGFLIRKIGPGRAAPKAGGYRCAMRVGGAVRKGRADVFAENGETTVRCDFGVPAAAAEETQPLLLLEEIRD